MSQSQRHYLQGALIFVAALAAIPRSREIFDDTIRMLLTEMQALMIAVGLYF